MICFISLVWKVFAYIDSNVIFKSYVITILTHYLFLFSFILLLWEPHLLISHVNGECYFVFNFFVFVFSFVNKCQHLLEEIKKKSKLLFYQLCKLCSHVFLKVFDDDLKKLENANLVIYITVSQNAMLFWSINVKIWYFHTKSVI